MVPRTFTTNVSPYTNVKCSQEFKGHAGYVYNKQLVDSKAFRSKQPAVNKWRILLAGGMCQSAGIGERVYR